MIIGNGNNGVLLNGAPNNSIGGTAAGAGNIISSNSYGISMNGSGTTGNIVQGNFIGTDITGTTKLGYQSGGINMNGASNNTIGGTAPGAGNLISGNLGTALILFGGSNENIIQGNRIGVDINGTTALSNGTAGISIFNSSNNQIGGPQLGARNIISANGTNSSTGGPGISIFSTNSTASGNISQGNYIGTDITGTVKLGNTTYGVEIEHTPGNIIGGSAAGAGNLISGNLASGVYILGKESTGTTLLGNFIGTNASGKANLGNGHYGIHLDNASGTTIGGKDAGAGNLVSGNAAGGVYIAYSMDGNTLIGNLIGTDRTGTANIGNGYDGIEVNYSANNIIGGKVAGAGNRIAGNGRNGVNIYGYYGYVATNNAIQGNAIENNARLGIDLGDDGVTLNDPGDTDSGPNDLQNFPVLTSFGGGVLSGALSSAGNVTYRVEFFASAACDSSGYGEGEQLLGAQDVAADGSGSATFHFAYSPVSDKPYFTATATNIATGNTSEFSPCFPQPSVLRLSVSPNSALSGQPVTLTATVRPVVPGAGIPTGTINFMDGSVLMGSAPLTPGNQDGATATLTTSFQGLGSHAITASFPGDANFTGSRDSASLTIVDRVYLPLLAR